MFKQGSKAMILGAPGGLHKRIKNTAGMIKTHAGGLSDRVARTPQELC
jgi:hypothetical protein